jgi:hypothetical protein
LSCEKEATFVEPLPDYAAIHWVHAVPDTMQLDFRVVDMVSNAGVFDANFRATNMFAQGIEAGTRTVRVFLSSTDPAIASQVLQESSLQVTEGQSYTYIQAGFARTGQLPARTTIMIPDNFTVPPAGQISLRIVNVGAGLGTGGAVDAWVVRRPVNAATADSLPDTRTVANLAFGAAAPYAMFGRDSVAADTARVVFTAAGTKTPILATVVAPAGDPGSATAGPIAGSRVALSVMTALLVPRSVAGSSAPQTTAFTTPTVLYLVDRRPCPVGTPC